MGVCQCMMEEVTSSHHVGMSSEVIAIVSTILGTCACVDVCKQGCSGHTNYSILAVLHYN